MKTANLKSGRKLYHVTPDDPENAFVCIVQKVYKTGKVRVGFPENDHYVVAYPEDLYVSAKSAIKALEKDLRKKEKKLKKEWQAEIDFHRGLYVKAMWEMDRNK